MNSELTARLRVVTGDITALQVDAIVNAANSSLSGGGGVDGAIHRAAGRKLVVASRKLAPCPTGEARITPGFNLHAAYVIHTVGPIYQDGQSGESELLGAAYRSSLALAEEADVREIAFPCISTGIYGYPKEDACKVAVANVARWLTEHTLPQQVIFCCFDSGDADLYLQQLQSLDATT